MPSSSMPSFSFLLFALLLLHSSATPVHPLLSDTTEKSNPSSFQHITPQHLHLSTHTLPVKPSIEQSLAYKFFSSNRQQGKSIFLNTYLPHHDNNNDDLKVAPNTLTHDIRPQLMGNAQSLHQLSMSSEKDPLHLPRFSTKHLITRNQLPQGTHRMLNLDPCTSQEECAGSRICREPTNNLNICPAEAEICRCFPMDDNTCRTTTDCDSGEICAVRIDGGMLLCISEAIVTGNPTIYRPAGEGGSPPPIDTAPPSTSTGLDFEDCRTDDDCTETNICLQLGEDTTSCPVDTERCICSPATSNCSSTAECDTGEVCVQLITNALMVCVSETFVTENPEIVSPPVTTTAAPTTATTLPTTTITSTTENSEIVSPPVTTTAAPTTATTLPTTTITSTSENSEIVSPPVTTTAAPTTATTTTSTGENDDAVEEGVCIDAKALEHLDADDLVFASHARARVLCDRNVSCATSGHMVIFQGKAMMMGSYCEMVGDCTKEEMYVNSPRYSVALRVKSNTEGLEYTAFSARYETRAEEGVLSAAVHVGL